MSVDHPDRKILRSKSTAQLRQELKIILNIYNVKELEKR